MINCERWCASERGYRSDRIDRLGYMCASERGCLIERINSLVYKCTNEKKDTVQTVSISLGIVVLMKEGTRKTV